MGIFDKTNNEANRSCFYFFPSNADGDKKIKQHGSWILLSMPHMHMVKHKPFLYAGQTNSITSFSGFE